MEHEALSLGFGFYLLIFLTTKAYELSTHQVLTFTKANQSH